MTHKVCKCSGCDTLNQNISQWIVPRNLTWLVMSLRRLLWPLQSWRGRSLSLLPSGVSGEFSVGLVQVLLGLGSWAALDSNRAHRALVPADPHWGWKSMERLRYRLGLRPEPHSGTFSLSSLLLLVSLVCQLFLSSLISLLSLVCQVFLFSLISVVFLGSTVSRSLRSVQLW